MSNGDGSGGGSGSTIKIVIAVVILAVAGYFVYANLFSGGEPPTSAIDNLPPEKKQELEKEVENRQVPEEQIGGA